MMIARALLLPLLLAILLTVPSACTVRPENVPAETSGVAVRDSAGVEIVELGPSAFDDLPEWVLAAPILTVGTDARDPRGVIGRVLDATLLPDGRLAVADNLSHRVVVFDEAGSVLSLVGSQGGGPGEYTYLTGLSARGDTISVLGGSPMEIIRCLPDGTLVDESRWMQAGDTLRNRFEVTRPRAGRVFILQRTVPGSQDLEVEEISSDSVSVAVVSIDEAGVDSIATYGIQPIVRVRVPDAQALARMDSSATPFGLGGSIPMRLTPSVRMDAGDHDAVIGITQPFLLSVHAIGGALRRVIRGTPPQVRTADIPARDLRRWVDVISGPRDGLAHVRSVELFGAPDVMPAFHHLRVGEDGAIWLLTDAGPLGEGGIDWLRWLRLDPGGMPSGYLRIPVGYRVREFRADRIVAVVRDELNVERVIVAEFE